MSAAPEHQNPDLFLLSQQLSELTTSLRGRPLAPADIRALVCRTDDLHDNERKQTAVGARWRSIARGPDANGDSVLDLAATTKPGSRFGLVCDAGLGKTCNMLWLFEKLCAAENRHLFGAKVPFLIRMDESTGLKLVGKAFTDRDVLLDEFAKRVDDRKQNLPFPRACIRAELLRKRTQSQLILLFDGLDHALTIPDFPTHFAELLNSDHWKHCPVWVSGRPYAFKDSWDDLFAPGLSKPPNWKFLRVERFSEPQIREYTRLNLGEGDWFGAFPRGSRWLLGIPRLLKLVCEIVRSARSGAPDRAPRAVVAELGLMTATDVYHTAYFKSGTFGKPDSYGLIAQGNKGVVGEDEVRRFIGLRDRVALTATTVEDCIKRTGEVIGEIAFHLFNANSDAEKPEPNTSGMPVTELRTAVAERLMDDAQRLAKCDLFDRDLELLKYTNAHHLDFLLLAESGDRVRFENRSAQAFFAAHWALNYGTAADGASLRKWITDKTAKGEELQGFEEFWQFAREFLRGRDCHQGTVLPNRVDPERWRQTFAPCYAAPQLVRGTRDWVHWHRRMVHDTFAAMRDRFPEVVARWRASEGQLGSSGHHKLLAFLSGDNFRPILAGVCQFGADPIDKQPGRAILVVAYELHRYPVTNAIFELFDPGHKSERWQKEPHPLARLALGGDDLCPVVNVTWWDAWCFTKWCGEGYGLPAEEQWEHAYRAGTVTRFWFGNDDGKLPEYAWFLDNSGDMTRPVGMRPVSGKAHPSGLFDMAGNVWEWCDTWYDNERMSHRVVCGGSWFGFACYCRAAHRDWVGPGTRTHSVGFRLSRPGPS